MTFSAASPRRRPPAWLALAGGLAAIACLVALGTWQVERLHWKGGLLAKIDSRIHAAPLTLAAVESRFAGDSDIEYLTVNVAGTFLNGSERHFLSTWQGASGYDVFTPLSMDDGRIVFINRGFVPYDRKDPATRASGQLGGRQTVTGLARKAPAEKPSRLLPDNDPAKNVFYWKDLAAMRASAGLPSGAAVLPFFIDAGAEPANPGGLPHGGVTIIDLPNNHLQYALTWYGLAAALAAVMATYLMRRRPPRGGSRP